ncbi:MAG TPA: hypothetical protein VL490_04980 [Mucilaginibacter sp.]|nr:hypothetical protein [Mucilaginibacter sp.]
MKTNRLITLTLISISTTIAGAIWSCNKENTVKTTFTEDAIIIDAGPVAADGCGWEIKTGADSVYSPINLDTKYQINNLKVHITYEILDSKFQCGSVAQNKGLIQIKLDAISKVSDFVVLDK